MRIGWGRVCLRVNNWCKKVWYTLNRGIDSVREILGCRGGTTVKQAEGIVYDRSAQGEEIPWRTIHPCYDLQLALKFA